MKTPNDFASVMWAVSVFAFVAIIMASTNFFTHDPTFGSGGAEHWYLLPMLISVAAGFGSFAMMLFTGVLIGAKPHKVVLPTIILLLCFGTFFFGYRQALKATGVLDPQYTGQQVFDAVNVYRVSRGLKEIPVDPALCDNLVQRWLDLTNPDNAFAGHEGSVRWAEQEGLRDRYDLAELYMKNSPSPDATVSWWAGSPGHRTTVEGNYTSGCAYADKGTSVVILGKLIY